MQLSCVMLEDETALEKPRKKQKVVKTSC